MTKIQLSHRMYSVDDLKRLVESKEFTIQPKYQRRRTAWPLNAKTGLIDTIVLNYPIPPIYMNSFIDDSGRRRREIIDGQQRVTTILEFLNGEFALSGTFSDPDSVGSKFNELSPEIQNMIRDYEISCMALRGAGESDVVAIFSKINSFSLPLNDQERRNAVYAGEFKTTVYDLANDYYGFWRGFDVLGDASIARMKDAELVSELFSTIKNGLIGIQKKHIENMYAECDDSFPQKRKMEKLFNQIMSYIGTLFEDEDVRSQFRKVSWFFPLFLILYDQCYGSLGSYSLELAKAPNLDLIRTRLVSFIDKYKRGALTDTVRLLFQQGTKAPSKIQQRLQYLTEATAGA